MSVDMYVSASKNQAKSVSGMTKQQTTGYEELQKAIADFTLNSPFLTGKAYDTSKAFFSTVLYPLAQGGILLSEAVDKAVTKFPQDYQFQVDSGNLKQSDLEEKIRQADRLIGQAEGIRTMLESSLTPDIIKSSQLAANLRLLESYSGVKRILEEKLDKLMTFNHDSPRIFEEIQALEDAIDQGLAQTTTAFNPATGTFTIPNKGALSWSKTIQEKWSTRDEDEQQRIKEKIEKENLPTTKAEILRDYHWSTNSNMYVNNKTGIPSPEVTGLYNMFVQAEHTSQKNPQLEFFNEMLRTGKHPTTGAKITEAERANAVLMLYTLALQPFVGAWAMSKIPQSADKLVEVKKTESNVNWEAKQPISGEQWNSYFKEKYGAENVQWKANSFSEIVVHPERLYGATKSEVKAMLGEGWVEDTYGSAGGGWKFINTGDGSVFYHPGGGIHSGSYYGFSSGDTGKIKIVGNDYINFLNDKATIIKFGGD